MHSSVILCKHFTSWQQREINTFSDFTWGLNRLLRIKWATMRSTDPRAILFSGLELQNFNFGPKKILSEFKSCCNRIGRSWSCCISVVMPCTDEIFLIWHYFALHRYLYCDEICVEPESVLATLYAAKKYIVPYLAHACVQFLETSLSYKNACILLSQSCLFEEAELTQRCWEVRSSAVKSRPSR